MPPMTKTSTDVEHIIDAHNLTIRFHNTSQDLTVSISIINYNIFNWKERGASWIFPIRLHLVKSSQETREMTYERLINNPIITKIKLQTHLRVDGEHDLQENYDLWTI